MLSKLVNLRRLSLGFLDDDDVAELEPLKQLTCLSLAYSGGVTDDAVEVFMQLERLEQLDLGRTAITTKTINRLSRLPKLTQAGLNSCEDLICEHARTYKRWSVDSRDCLKFYDDSEGAW